MTTRTARATGILAVTGMVLLTTGCSIARKSTVGMMIPVIDNTLDTSYRNGDLQLVEDGIPGNLILIDGLIETSPGNERLLEIATQLYFSYAVGFVEDEDPERAESLYRKAMTYGFMRYPDLSPDEHIGRGADSTFAAALDEYDDDDVPGLLWLGGAWGSVIKLNLDDPSMVSQLRLVEKLTERAVALDPAYLYGMPHLMLGTVYALRPPAFGGDSDKALEQFEAGFAVSDRRFLMMHVFFARYYCRQIFDEELFDQTLAELGAADPEALPDVLLLNRMAQKQGLHLEAVRDELF